jgi:hypothetical protein
VKFVRILKTTVLIIVGVNWIIKPPLYIFRYVTCCDDSRESELDKPTKTLRATRLWMALAKKPTKTPVSHAPLDLHIRGHGLLQHFFAVFLVTAKVNTILPAMPTREAGIAATRPNPFFPGTGNAKCGWIGSAVTTWHAVLHVFFVCTSPS